MSFGSWGRRRSGMMSDVGSYRITTGTGLRLYIIVFAAIWIGILMEIMLHAKGPARYLPLVIILLGCLWFSRTFGLVVEVSSTASWFGTSSAPSDFPGSGSTASACSEDSASAHR